MRLMEYQYSTKRKRKVGLMFPLYVGLAGLCVLIALLKTMKDEPYNGRK